MLNINIYNLKSLRFLKYKLFIIKALFPLNNFIQNNIFYCIKNNLINHFMLGCSSGNDSLALLFFLKAHFSKKNFSVLYFNHNTRQDSLTEKIYLKILTHSLKINFITKSSIHPLKNSSEELMRKYRYNFFYIELIQKSNSYLFLAHHLNDYLENLLIKFCTGSSISGIISPLIIKNIKNFFIIRPFLAHNKINITKIISVLNILCYEDSSNQSLKYTRNYIRHKIIPLLKEAFNKRNILKGIIRIKNNLTQDMEALNKWTNYIYSHICKKHYLNIKVLNKFPKAIKIRIIQKWIVKNNCNNPINDQIMDRLIKSINYQYFNNFYFKNYYISKYNNEYLIYTPI